MAGAKRQAAVSISAQIRNWPLTALISGSTKVTRPSNRVPSPLRTGSETSIGVPVRSLGKSLRVEQALRSRAVEVHDPEQLFARLCPFAEAAC